MPLVRGRADRPSGSSLQSAVKRPPSLIASSLPEGPSAIRSPRWDRRPGRTCLGGLLVALVLIAALVSFERREL